MLNFRCTSTVICTLLFVGCCAADSQVQIEANDAEAAALRHYDVREQTRRYINSLFAPQAVGLSVATASASSALRMAYDHLSPSKFEQTAAENFSRRTVAGSIEFGASALLRQDEQFRSSLEHGFRKRARYALYRAFVVQQGDRNEFAFPRIAAAFGAPWITESLYGQQRRESSPWVGTCWILAHYVLRSYWAEFKPEITREGLRLFKK